MAVGLAVVLAAMAGAPAEQPRDTVALAVRGEPIRVERYGAAQERVWIESAAMGRVMAVDVLRGVGDGPLPTLYLLDGVDGKLVSDWLTKGRAAEFFADKPVDVVLPAGGAGSMYSDWEQPDRVLGWNRWETFLTEELPAVVEPYLNGDGRRAVGGVSMGAQAAMMLAHRHPGLYRSVAGISGCYSTTDAPGRAVTTMTVGSRGGNVENLWGPWGSPEWQAHDSLLNAEGLRGTAVYVSAATGVPGVLNLAEALTARDAVEAMGVAGGGISLEAGAHYCTERFAQRLNELQIPATVLYLPTGIHSWLDFAVQLEPAWRSIAAAFGTAPGK
ncbi:alpha/beta hydrolase [Nocardia sp. NPDC057668]|uniref:alpha/beta hydrolase n=1 Tax=Nocardia sp. NPDC057668 TaxID=3346202 RepID=UPI003671B819